MRRKCIGDTSRRDFRAVSMYRPITMRLDGVRVLHVGFGNGRASVLTSGGRTGVGKKRPISLIYIFHDFPLTVSTSEKFGHLPQAKKVTIVKKKT